MYSKISALALLAAVAAAAHAPVGDPTGNPITRPLNEVVPACKPFEISWTPTTPNTVSLILLRGPSTNVVPLSTIVEGIANSGSFSWTPESSLEADTTHYGLQLIDDVTGQYQYSTQFGISKDDCEAVPSSSVESSGYPTATPSETETPYSSVVYPTATLNATTLTTYCSTTTVYAGTSSYVYSTGAPVVNSTVVLPSKSMTVPESLKSTPAATATGTGTPPPESTGAASALQAGLGLAGAVAGLVFML